MSHFTVLVILDRNGEGNAEQSVDAALAPYMENCCATPDKQYMQFYDTEDEYRKEWEEGTAKKIVMKTGELVDPWDDRFKVKDWKPGKSMHEPPKHLERREVPFKELYDDFDTYVEKWHGKKERDETYNRYGYWQNPEAKWDWYEIGGRWAGYFQLKPDRKGFKGSQYNMAQHYDKSNKADVCRKKDIDWETIREEAAEEAGKRWDIVNSVWDGLELCESWDSIRERHGSENIEDARKEYWAQPRVKAVQKREIADQIGWMADVERFQVSRETYIQRAVEQAGVTCAVVKDGKWYEQGKMGWWGIMSDEKDPETWASVFQQLLKSTPDESILVLVDAHI